jgi:hypothetical protein
MLSPTGALIDFRLEHLQRNWKWLADKLNIGDAMTSHIRVGRRALSAELMARISDLLDIPLADLEYACAVQKGSCELALDSTRRRACALAIMRVWRACSDDELGKFQRLAEKIHGTMVADR